MSWGGEVQITVHSCSACCCTQSAEFLVNNVGFTVFAEYLLRACSHCKQLLGVSGVCDSVLFCTDLCKAVSLCGDV